MAGGGGGVGGGVEDHETISAGNYSQLLLSDEDNSCYNFAAAAFSADQNPPRMLCFGPDDHFNKGKCDLFFEEVGAKLAEKTAGVTCSSGGGGGGGGGGQPSPVTVAFSPGASSTTNAGAGRGYLVRGVSPAAYAAPIDQQRISKKPRVADYSPAPTPRHAKVKKESLGERIMALQQLVSPFGKTDTASVLQEASGYIRFLQDQIQALCSPYLQRLPPPAHLLAVKDEEGAGKDLRSIGLCLVPADLTAHVAEANGADLWAPGSTSFQMTSQR